MSRPAFIFLPKLPECFIEAQIMSEYFAKCGSKNGISSFGNPSRLTAKYPNAFHSLIMPKALSLCSIHSLSISEAKR